VPKQATRNRDYFQGLPELSCQNHRNRREDCSSNALVFVFNEGNEATLRLKPNGDCTNLPAPALFRCLRRENVTRVVKNSGLRRAPASPVAFPVRNRIRPASRHETAQKVLSAKVRQWW
jgi:hypothetical protein